jgi:hypothetical protein
MYIYKNQRFVCQLNAPRISGYIKRQSVYMNVWCINHPPQGHHYWLRMSVLQKLGHTEICEGQRRFKSESQCLVDVLCCGFCESVSQFCCQVAAKCYPRPAVIDLGLFIRNERFLWKGLEKSCHVDSSLCTPKPLKIVPLFVTVHKNFNILLHITLNQTYCTGSRDGCKMHFFYRF